MENKQQSFSKFWRLDVPDCSAEGPLPHRPFIVSSHGGRAGELCGVSFLRALMPFMMASPLGPNHYRRPHFLIPTRRTLGFQHIHLEGGGGRHKHSNHNSAQTKQCIWPLSFTPTIPLQTGIGD